MQLNSVNLKHEYEEENDLRNLSFSRLQSVAIPATSENDPYQMAPFLSSQNPSMSHMSGVYFTSYPE